MMEPVRKLRDRSRKSEIVISDSDSEVEEVTVEGIVASNEERSNKRPSKPKSPRKKAKKDDEDDVRAPIPQKNMLLSEGDHFAVLSNSIARNNGSFVSLRDQFREQRTKKSSKNSSVFDSLRDYRADQEDYLRGVSGQGSSKRQDLATIFRPPQDLMTNGTFDEARNRAVSLRRWLLINLHNYTEFGCQKLIRDCMRNEAVKEIIKENFVFWQVNHDTKEGLRYAAHYHVASFPHMAILDPRTGEKVRTYGELDATGFCREIMEFLAEKPSYDPAGPISSEAKPPTVSRSDSIQTIDLEQEELEMAMKLSMEEGKKKEKGEIEDMDDIIESFDDDNEIIPDTPPKTDLKEPEEVQIEDWKDHLGSADPEVALKIRLPNGESVDVSMPNSSKIEAVWLFIASKGFPTKKYDIFTSFPRKSVTSLPAETLLNDAGFSSREVLIVQERDLS